MNKVFLIGNLTKDVELNKTTSGVSFAKFTLAVSKRFLNADGERDVDFINIIAWRKFGELCHKYLGKGSKVAVMGNLQTRSYEAQDGTKRHATEVILEDISFLTPKGASDLEVVKQPDFIDDDSLPF